MCLLVRRRCEPVTVCICRLRPVALCRCGVVVCNRLISVELMRLGLIILIESARVDS